MLLCSLRTQLPGMDSLELFQGQSWAGATSVWREVGAASQLTSLVIDIDDEVSRHAFVWAAAGAAKFAFLLAVVLLLSVPLQDKTGQGTIT